MAGFLVKNLFRAQKGIAIGGGTTIKKAKMVTGSFVLGTVNTVSAKEINLADADAAAGDLAVASVPASGASAGQLADDLVFMGVRAIAGTVIATVYNPTGGNIAGGTVTIPYMLLDIT